MISLINNVLTYDTSHLRNYSLSTKKGQNVPPLITELSSPVLKNQFHLSQKSTV